MQDRSNRVKIAGVVKSPFRFNHEVYGERFYIFSVESLRLSGTEDEIPVMVSERLVDVSRDMTGAEVSISGQFRSYNQHNGGKMKLLLYAFVFDIEFPGEIECQGDVNEIVLNGYLCKKPNYRTTPLGREIADVLLAVNRDYGKSDYIPCIFWGRNAKFVSNMPVGAGITVEGRIQSREYKKLLENGDMEVRTAYEVSVKSVKSESQEEEHDNQTVC